MKKVAIISFGYLWFPCESGTSRFFQIANTFVDEGWYVECITTSFQHFQKKARDKQLIYDQNYPFKITFIDTPAYKKNIDIRRVISNKVAEHNLKKYLENRINIYDAIYITVPANNIAAMVSKMAKKYNIPVIVDIEDLWPEAMAMVIKRKRVRDFLLHSFKKDAETTYSNASGIIGTSEDYTDRAFAIRKRDIPSKTVYVGVNLSDFDEGVDEYNREIVKPEGEFWVTYTGSISNSYDIKTLIDAGHELKKYNVHIQILGTGSLKEELEKYSKNMDNIHFWGFTPYKKMAAVLSKSDIVVNSFVKGAPQSIVNKVGDYLASGKPIINTLENPVFCDLIEKNGIGINVEAENVTVLSNAIMKFKDNVSLIKTCGKNGRFLAETKFDRKTSYLEITNMVGNIVADCN